MNNGRYFGIIDIVHLDVRKLETIDIDRLKSNLQSLGYHGEPFLNEFGFCPHIIAALDDDGNLFVDNTNSGNYSAHTRQHHVIECTTIDEFLQQVATLCGKQTSRKSNTLTETGTLF